MDCKSIIKPQKYKDKDVLPMYTKVNTRNKIEMVKMYRSY